ncbi:MAG TPA: Hsp20/alpha crystallin family protein [Ruminococcaceae bacterium]|nr:Hsp20/alpha crystallin family protein [Oscillospiraceae bacterium]
MLATYRNNIFDDLFNTPFFTRSEQNMMKTDIKEHDGGYELTVDLPGVKKDDIKAELNDGYLTITAENNSSKDEKDEKGKYICRERYSGSYSRSFYVGDAVTEEDIKAKFENGTLTLDIPKKEALPEKQNKYIAIG